MQFQEVVEAQGHLIDSHIMEQIFDQVVEFGGRFEVEEFRVGRTNSEPSYLRLKVESTEQATMERLLQQLLGLPQPAYRHHCLILDAAGRKLSKSTEATGLRELRAGGATPTDIRRLVGLP